MKPWVLITGATSGFGEATAQLFASNNYNLIITGRREERLLKLEEELSSKCEVMHLTFDVREEKACEEAINSIPLEIRQKIEILVNNAGLAVGKSSIEDGLTDDWNRMIDTNVKGLLYISRLVIPYLKANKKGHIVNIASIAGKQVYLGGNVYCATKHAVDALSQAMRMELVDYNIKVTNIAPGAAETEFSLVRFKGDQEVADNVYKNYEPLIAKDIADTIWFVTQTPAHVTINDLTIMPTAQATATLFKKM